jgi:2-enoate reductase
LSCSVNPGLVSYDIALKKVSVSKRILVIGGGPGGMETARLAATLGHKVMMLERESRLGGHLLEASAPKFKRDLRRLLNWLITQLGKKNIDIKLNCEGSPEIIRQEAPDVLVIAIGSEYFIPSDLSGIDKDIVFPHDVLLRKKYIGSNVVVVGGGSVGCETALYVAEALRRKVTIVEMQDDILLDMETPMNMMTLMMKLKTSSVEIKTGLKFKGFSEYKVLCENNSGESQQLEADSVIMATGLRPRQAVVNSLEGLVSQVFKVGDCVQPKDIYHVFRAAWETVFSF